LLGAGHGGAGGGEGVGGDREIGDFRQQEEMGPAFLLVGVVGCVPEGEASDLLREGGVGVDFGIDGGCWPDVLMPSGKTEIELGLAPETRCSPRAGDMAGIVF